LHGALLRRALCVVWGGGPGQSSSYPTTLLTFFLLKLASCVFLFHPHSASCRSRGIRERHRQFQTCAVARQCRARFLSSVAGNFLCTRARVPILVSRCVNTSNHADGSLYACHHCCEISRTRYHLRLFRSRQPTLEFPISSRDQSRNSSWVACTFLQSNFPKQTANCALIPFNLCEARGVLLFLALVGLVCCETKQTRYDSETEIWEVPAVFAQERFEDRQTKKSRHVQQQSCSEKTRTRGPVFQTALELVLQML